MNRKKTNHEPGQGRKAFLILSACRKTSIYDRAPARFLRRWTMSDNPIHDAVNAIGAVTKEQLEERLNLLEAEAATVRQLIALKDGKVLARKPRKKKDEVAPE
jgi:hypothetical protein